MGHAARVAAMIFGALAVAMGLLWVGQGLGIVHWPKSSFMLEQRQWALYGAVLAAIGLGIVIYAGRAGRR